ncbi:hypothetical protein CCACVL1_00670 [Corchorus capsularis]|uniref:Uncharacterized protein n=1 Tax=Corchorus capsularis TaxID=210143 RepID=A0A1R3KVM4_COCAP|nr:hypothetical protein CCACVL1_00670 [Corchorus capsularis]
MPWPAYLAPTDPARPSAAQAQAFSPTRPHEKDFPLRCAPASARQAPCPFPQAGCHPGKNVRIGSRNRQQTGKQRPCRPDLTDSACQRPSRTTTHMPGTAPRIDSGRGASALLVPRRENPSAEYRSCFGGSNFAQKKLHKARPIVSQVDRRQLVGNRFDLQQLIERSGRIVEIFGILK